VSGVNRLEFIINNTNTSIYGPVQASGPSVLIFQGSIVPTIVPEPAIWSLMLVGTGGVGAWVRGRRGRTAAAL
jgi:hypothetical protein